jgi:2,3-bisphosphoglycerate-independent phosphoglycerate mutase
MGYDPAVYYTGRAPIEAAARGIESAADDLIFRCNLVTVADGVMEDFTAGHISQREAERVITDLQAVFGAELRVTFHTGMSYRHLMLMHDAEEVQCECAPPHDITGEATSRHLPTGRGAERVLEAMERARAVLSDHDVNQVRRDLGENPATDIWLWGQGRHRSLDTLESRFGVRGACIAAVDLIKGVALNAGLRVITVAGATGYLDTDYRAKGRAAVAALDKHDFVVVHIEAPDEAGHLGDAAAKVKAIEQVDEAVVGPILKKLKQLDPWRVAIVPDHPTPVATRRHSKTPPPFCVAGAGISSTQAEPFSETAAVNSKLLIDPGHEFMEFFLRSGAAR